MDLFEQQVVEALEKTEKLVNNKKKKRKKWRIIFYISW